MIEVEIKLKINSIDELKTNLYKNGFVQGDTLKEIDTYFDNKNGDIRFNDSALRIRETINETKNTKYCQLNYKGKKFDNKTMTRPEFETEVGDAKTAEKILNSLGYYGVQPNVVKLRQMYRTEQMNACIDRIDGLGDYLELEMVVENEVDKEFALGCIEAVLNELGYKMKDTTTTSYLSALQLRV